MTVRDIRLAVAMRDGYQCIAPRLDEHCGLCHSKWGDAWMTVVLSLEEGEMDYVRQGAIGARHELVYDHVWLCPGHHRGTGPTAGLVWATSHRPQLRAYLEPYRARFRAPMGLVGMISRRRSPDRPNDASRDIQHGGGPVGRAPRHISDGIGATRLADAAQPAVKLKGLFLDKPGHTRAWRAKTR